MITKISEWIMITFLAIAFVRFMCICMGHMDERALNACDEEEKDVLRALRGSLC